MDSMHKELLACVLTQRFRKRSLPQLLVSLIIVCKRAEGPLPGIKSALLNMQRVNALRLQLHKVYFSLDILEVRELIEELW